MNKYLWFQGISAYIIAENRTAVCANPELARECAEMELPSGFLFGRYTVTFLGLCLGCFHVFSIARF